MKKPQAVLFDLDGTLVDSLTDIGRSMNAALERVGYPAHPIEKYKTMVGDGVGVLSCRVLPEGTDHKIVHQCEDFMREEYSLRWNNSTKLYPGISDLLDSLTQKRVPMGILSNKPHDFTLLNVRQFLPRWKFKVVMGIEKGRKKKPDPEGALSASRILGVSCMRILYLGDTDTDMKTARAAGMIPAGVLWGFRDSHELRAHGALRLFANPRPIAAVF